MNFEDMKKIWDTENQEHVFVLDQGQLSELINSKKINASRTINRIEILLMMVNMFTGVLILVLNVIKVPSTNIFVYLLAAFMFGSAGYIAFNRMRRLKDESRFDRTTLGDLDHAIANATYQANLSWVMLLTVVPVFALSFLSAFYSNKSPLALIAITILFVVAFFLGRWEHRGWHVARKRRLIAMRNKLVQH